MLRCCFELDPNHKKEPVYENHRAKLLGGRTNKCKNLIQEQVGVFEDLED